VILTCYNRREKTVKCLTSLKEGNPNTDFKFVVVDDLSTDGTVEAIWGMDVDADVIAGTGNLFWNGGMHRGIGYCLEKLPDACYYMLVNDDVDFYPNVIDDMVKACKNSVLVGATCDSDGNYSYGGILYHKHGIRYDKIGPKGSDISCTTFNANCVLIPGDIFRNIGNMDPYYKHSMGDFDYGFKFSRAGYGIHVHEAYVGVCNDNPDDGTWQDTSLGIRERIRRKESRKGLPAGDWFHYLNKNFGFGTAVVRSITPYIKILLGK
jgi:GT2 family glycosyltransferase